MEKHTVQLSILLSNAEKKAILYNHETIDEIAQSLITRKAFDYMEKIARQTRNANLEEVITALSVKTKVEIIAERIAAEKLKEK